MYIIKPFIRLFLTMIHEIIITILIVFSTPLPWWLMIFHKVNKRGGFSLRVITYLSVGVVWAVLGFLAFTNQGAMFGDRFDVSSLTVGLGVVFIVLAVVIDWQVIRYLGLKRLICITEIEGKSKNQLVTAGIYKYARHPRYIEYPFWFLGFGLIFGYVFLLFFAVYIFLSLWLATYIEEEELVSRFGKQYVEYKKRVPRFFVRI
jgi:protein-S-isoprenylcysteine O-methyltransferase Ste14